MKISEVKSAGVVRKPFQVTLARKDKLTETTVKFVLEDGRSKIVALAFGDRGLDLFNDLIQGHRYEIVPIGHGVKAQKRNLKYKKLKGESTSRFDLLFYHVEHKLISTPKSVDVQLSDIKRVSQFIKKKKYGNYDVKSCMLVGGSVYLYMGCEKCTKSIREPNKKGKFYCGTCGKKDGERKRKPCMIISGIKVVNEKGDHVDNLICFDKEAQVILERTDSEFLHDNIARDLYRDKIKNQLYDFIVFLKKGKNGPESIIKGLQKARGNPFSSTSYTSDDALNEYLTTLRIEEPLEETPIDKPPRGFKRYVAPYEYPISAINPGHVLIINNVNFQMKEYKTRTGSDVDVKNIRWFFQQLDYRITLKSDVQDVEELTDILSQFKASVIKDKPSSIFIFILSHGENMEIVLCGPHLNIEGHSMVNKVNLYDHIINKFSEKNFPEYQGSPKIFFDCTCGSFQLTFHGSNQLTANEVDWTESSKSKIKKNKDFLTDIYICHAAVPGTASWRNKETGTCFVRTLIEVFLKSCSTTPFADMLGMVQAKLQDFCRDEQIEFSQLCIFYPLRFRPFCFHCQSLN